MNTPNKQAELEKEIEKLNNDVKLQQTKLFFLLNSSDNIITDLPMSEALKFWWFMECKAELKGIKEALADEIEFLKDIIQLTLDGYDGIIWKAIKERLAKLQSPNKSEETSTKTTNVRGNKQVQTGSDTIQKAISEFKEKLQKILSYPVVAKTEERKRVIEDFAKAFSEEIEKTAQEMK
jgi:hypothetical protein